MDERLPRGQRWIDDLIVYDIARVSPQDMSTFTLRLSGLLEIPMELTWQQLLELPCARIVRDVHCVTTWSVKDVVWEGVRTRDILDRVLPSANVSWVLAHGRDGYTTSVPFDAFGHPDSLLAYRMNDAPLPMEHGGPLRLVIPSLYAWKSAKYVNRLEFAAQMKRGFWEERGYHDRGDPWLEERFRV